MTGDTRSKIIRAACDLLVKEGVRALTLERAAEHAHLSKGGVLYYFSNKQDLIEAIVRYALAESQALLADGGGEKALEHFANPESGPGTQLVWVLLAASDTCPQILEKFEASFSTFYRDIGKTGLPTHVIAMSIGAIFLREMRVPLPEFPG